MEKEQQKEKKKWERTNAWGCRHNDDGQYQTFADGDLLFGEIRCTYVERFDQDNNKIVSINRDAMFLDVQYLYPEFKESLFYTEKIHCKSKDKIAVKLNLAPDAVDDNFYQLHMNGGYNKLKNRGKFIKMLKGEEFAYIRPNACKWQAKIDEKPIEIEKPKSNSFLKWLTIGLTLYGSLK